MGQHSMDISSTTTSTDRFFLTATVTVIDVFLLIQILTEKIACIPTNFTENSALRTSFGQVLPVDALAPGAWGFVHP